MIQSFLKRGFDWPSQKQLRPTSKRQRKKATKWLERNEERMQYARRKILAKGGWQYDHEDDYKPSPEQKEEWNSWLKRITGDITSQKEYEKKQTVIRGLIKKVLKGIDCQTAKGFIPKDHWVYITMRYWLEEKKEENDQWAEAMRINMEYEKQRKVSMKEMDGILEERHIIAMKEEERMPIRPTEKEKTPMKSLGEKSNQKEEETGQSGQNIAIGDHPVYLDTILEESPVAEAELLTIGINNSMDERPPKQREKDSHATQIRATECQSTQNQAAANQPSTQRATESIASIFRATSSHTAHSECHTVPIHTVACETPTVAKPTKEDTANQLISITPKLIDPLAFTRRHAHYPATLEEDLLTGQYACEDTTSPIIHYIDWSTYTHKDNWTYNITQEIMENRAMSLDDWELEVWANAIDAELKLTCIDEYSEDWDVTDKQLDRINHHLRSATEWFRQQPMQTRLHRLNLKGWLAERIYLYVQGRTTWPWQMGPAPINDIERRLIELWHNSNRKWIPEPPSVIQEYTAWWRKAKQQAYSPQQLAIGNQLTTKAERLAHSLNKMPKGSHAEQEVLHYVTKGTAWPTTHSLQPPRSQLQQEVVTSWWANHRERLDRQWGPRYRPHLQAQAQILWHQCTMANDASDLTADEPHMTITRSRPKATQRIKPTRRDKQTPWKNTPHRKQLPCKAK